VDTAQLLVTILGAGGGGAALLALINGLLKWLNGSAGRERDKNTDLIAQRRKAVEERETAERAREEADIDRRNAYEYVSLLRRQLIEAGLDPVRMQPEAPTESKYKGKEEDERQQQPERG
jgi:hypothetical protein